MLAEIYKGFSCPAEPLDAEVLDAILTAHMQRVVDAFLDRYAGPLEQSGEGLVETLADWPSFSPSRPDVWNTAFGIAERLTKLEAGEEGSFAEPGVYGARLALAMQAAGLPGAFESRFDKPARLRFDRFFLPPTREISARGDGSRVLIELDGGRRGLLVRDGGWRVEHPIDGAEALRQVPTGVAGARPVTFVAEEVLGDERQEGIPYPVAPATDEVEAAWAAAFDLIGRCSPAYLRWIGRGLREIVPVAAPDGAMISGSHTQRWGEIYMTDKLAPLKLAEMLVHECSHQHYFFGCFLSRVEDGSDPTLYYSPLKKVGRPLDKILLGYHAFANVILFFRECREQGVETGVEEGTILPELAQLEAPLRQTHGLTELGRAIWEPLAERIAESA